MLYKERINLMSVSFSGGIKIRIGRDKVRDFESKPLMMCPKHYYPLTGKNGISYKPLVQTGDTVLLGQQIASTADSWELPMHSSVSGKVIGIEDCPSPAGTVKAIVIDNDELYKPIDSPATIPDYENADKRDIILALQNAGIADLCGGEFLCGEALLSAAPKYLIVNAVDGEPYTAAASRRLAENADDIIEGIRALMDLLGVKNAYIAVESNFSDGISAAAGAVRYDEKINIITVKSKYPQHDERMLIKAVLGKSLPRGKSPYEFGSIVTTPEVLYHINKVLKTGMPVTEQIVSISGSAFSSPENFRVPFGVPISFLISETHTLSEVPERIIVNGPMKGSSLSSAETVTTKEISSVQVFKAPHSRSKIRFTPSEHGSCIRCGRCVTHCPAQLIPFRISDASLDYRPSKAMKYHALDCIQCGTCSYVCPSAIPLAENIASIADSIKRLHKEDTMDE